MLMNLTSRWSIFSARRLSIIPERLSAASAGSADPVEEPASPTQVHMSVAFHPSECGLLYKYWGRITARGVWVETRGVMRNGESLFAGGAPAHLDRVVWLRGYADHGAER